ncbi:TRAP transporter large permease subunit [Pararhizobium arenae]|uniref:TRAP transporter large permease subunit n=1 Tax=Pararhizobium arenae TaxID=1856850 RepID=UPI00094B6C53|nr:TRAP transporter large permease subunit [Pararhizobium arenae]
MIILVFLGSLLAAMAIGMPIAYALLVSAVAMMLQLGLFDSQIIAQNLIGGVDSFPLMAVPFFMLAGEVMNRGGLSRRIIDLALSIVGHKSGGLGYVVIISATLLSAISGSAIADAAALAALLVPAMVAAGHQPARAAGLVASSSIIAPVIPPSIGLVLFGVTANVSITGLFLGGIVPGVVMAMGLAVTWYYLASKEKVVLPERASGRTILINARRAGWALLMPVIIIVGLKLGVFTPTEAAVVAAVYSIFVSVVIYRELTLSALLDVFVAAAKSTAMVMFLVGAAVVTSWLIVIADLPVMLGDMLEPLVGSPQFLMFVIVVIVLLVGTAMDMTPTILILTPVLMPIVREAGIDPIYFGIIFIITNSIGLITPPVGTVLNAVTGVTKIKMEDVIRGANPFLLAHTAVLLLLLLVPQIVTLPVSWMQ